jgi:xylan 1,4-beta-xylosidase
VDPQHGDAHPAYEAMGSPRYPTSSQIRDLRKAAELAAPETRPLSNGELTLTLPSYALALVTLK